jgi:small subunit ribosomal protein S14
LIQRELKRDKLVAQFAKKHAELKAIANDLKKSDEERAAARLGCRSCRATPTRPASATAARSPAVRAAPSASSAWPAHKIRELAFVATSPA